MRRYFFIVHVLWQAVQSRTRIQFRAFSHLTQVIEWHHLAFGDSVHVDETRQEVLYSALYEAAVKAFKGALENFVCGISCGHIPVVMTAVPFYPPRGRGSNVTT